MNAPIAPLATPLQSLLARHLPAAGATVTDRADASAAFRDECPHATEGGVMLYRTPGRAFKLLGVAVAEWACEEPVTP